MNRKIYSLRVSFLLIVILFSNQYCKDSSANKNHAVTSAERLPFVGTKYFETREGVSGTGTPHYVVNIKGNGDVIFSYEQINQADKSTITTDTFYAGQFKRYLRCNLDWDDFPRYYEITKDTIYEVDSNNNRLSLSDCCGFSDTEQLCPCKGILYAYPEK